MSTDRLKIYNGALLLIGDLRLASLSENREPRFLLDLVWNDNGVRYCLEQAQWHFAMRTMLLDYDLDITPAFGFPRAFTKPDDWVNTSGVFQDEFMKTPLVDYADEVGFWYANLDQIYVRYVSDDTSFGQDLSKWPSSFTEYVKAYFASRVVHKLAKDSGKIQFIFGPPGHPNRGWLHQTLLIAKNKAAMALPTTFPTRGSWMLARRAGMRFSRDGGNITQLIG